MKDIIDGAMKAADFFGVGKKSERDRKHDEELFDSLSEIISSEDVSDLCDSLCDDCEYYSSQFRPLLDATEFIEDEDNEFINDEIEDKACSLEESITDLWNYVQGAVLPHHKQDEDDDRRYTFNYKVWDRTVDNEEAAEEIFQDDMEEIRSLCEDVKDAYKDFRKQVREDLAV